MSQMQQHLKLLESIDWRLVSANAFRVLVILVLAVVAISMLNRVSRLFRAHITDRIHDAEQIKRAETLALVFRYIAGLTITIVAGMLILSEIGVSIAPILGAAGVVGIAVGFGAQSLIKDYFTGFFLLVENQLRHGDCVEVAGKTGMVEEITLRHVRLRDYDGTVYFVPNNLISTVANMSREFGYAVMDVSLATKESIDEVMKMMRKVGRELRGDPYWGQMVLADVEVAGVEKWQDASFVLRARMMTQPMQQAQLRREFYRRLKLVLDAPRQEEAAQPMALAKSQLLRPAGS